MNKSEMAALEKCWISELPQEMGGHGGIPAQRIGRAKVIDRLVSDGLIEPGTAMLGGRFPVKITGWRLTHAGRFAYCASCIDEPEPSQPTSAE